MVVVGRGQHRGTNARRASKFVSEEEEFIPGVAGKINMRQGIQLNLLKKWTD